MDAKVGHVVLLGEVPLDGAEGRGAHAHGGAAVDGHVLGEALALGVLPARDLLANLADDVDHLAVVLQLDGVVAVVRDGVLALAVKALAGVGDVALAGLEGLGGLLVPLDSSPILLRSILLSNSDSNAWQSSLVDSHLSRIHST